MMQYVIVMEALPTIDSDVRATSYSDNRTYTRATCCNTESSQVKIYSNCKSLLAPRASWTQRQRSETRVTEDTALLAKQQQFVIPGNSFGGFQLRVQPNYPFIVASVETSS